MASLNNNPGGGSTALKSPLSVTTSNLGERYSSKLSPFRPSSTSSPLQKAREAFFLGTSSTATSQHTTTTRSYTSAVTTSISSSTTATTTSSTVRTFTPTFTTTPRAITPTTTIATPSSFTPTAKRTPPSSYAPTTTRTPPSSYVPTTTRTPPSSYAPTATRTSPSIFDSTATRTPPSTFARTTTITPPSSFTPTTTRTPPSGTRTASTLVKGQLKDSEAGAPRVSMGNVSSTSLIDEVRQFCNDSSSKNAKELAQLLSNPHIEALMEAHDNVASKNYRGPSNHDIDEDEFYELRDMSRSASSRSGRIEDIDEDEDEEQEILEYPGIQDQIRVVGIRKSDDEPLGMTVKVNGEHLEIARILVGSLVDRQGLLRVGDTILEVNGRPVHKPEELYEQVRKSKNGSIQFKVVPALHDSVNPSPPCYMRALFNYDPSEDTLIPCKSLGIAFEHGDILEVVNQEDPNWWQARRVEDPNQFTGLIPSQDLEERRRAFVRPEFDYATKTNMCGTKVTKKKEKVGYQVQAHAEFDRAELMLYEEVCRMPPFERKTLVLIGAEGVGRRTLKTRLLNYDPSRFGSTLPHTSRPLRDGEEDGRQYHFVKREQMERDIADNKYLEWGEYGGHLYGTKLDSIRLVIRSGKMCIIDCSPQCLKLLKNAEMMPLVVFIGAPNIEQLRFMHEWGRNNELSSSRNYTFDRAFGRQSRRARTLQSLADFFEDEDLQATVEESLRIQRMYEKYFDMVIINNNFEKTFEQLREAIDALSIESQWVPVSWVYSE